MPRNTNKAAVSGKTAFPQISAKLFEELIPGPVTKEQFEDLFQNFKKAFIERALSEIGVRFQFPHYFAAGTATAPGKRAT